MASVSKRYFSLWPWEATRQTRSAAGELQPDGDVVHNAEDGPDGKADHQHKADKGIVEFARPGAEVDGGAKADPLGDHEALVRGVIVEDTAQPGVILIGHDGSRLRQHGLRPADRKLHPERACQQEDGKAKAEAQ